MTPNIMQKWFLGVEKMNELELLENINKCVTANAVFTGFILLFFILILLIRFMDNFDIIYKGDKKK